MQKILSVWCILATAFIVWGGNKFYPDDITRHTVIFTMALVVGIFTGVFYLNYERTYIIIHPPVEDEYEKLQVELKEVWSKLEYTEDQLNKSIKYCRECLNRIENNLGSDEAYFLFVQVDDQQEEQKVLLDEMRIYNTIAKRIVTEQRGVVDNAPTS